jgi:hypothetical protein
MRNTSRLRLIQLISIFLLIVGLFAVRPHQQTPNMLGFPPVSVAYAQACVNMNSLYWGANPSEPALVGLQANVSSSCTGTYRLYFDLTCQGAGGCSNTPSANTYTGPVSGDFYLGTTVGATRYNVRVAREGTSDYSATLTCVTNDANNACVSPYPDDDGDGVPDYRDDCRGSGSIGFDVYADGCPILDNDEDGVPDNLDACSTRGDEGYGIYPNGCPIEDSDGDGIPDNQDLCVNDFGLAPHGCPDTDGDGIPDHHDACPYEPGPASNNGCPLSVADPPPPPPLPSCPDGSERTDENCPAYTPPEAERPQIVDRDGDGVADEYDACPYVPGAEANSGCPYQPSNCQVANWGLRQVFIRSLPTTESNAIGRLSYQDFPLDTVGTYGDWYQVNYNGAVGFVRNDVIVTGETMLGCGGNIDFSSLQVALDIFSEEGCPLEEDDLAFSRLVSNPDYVLAFVAYSNAPCQALNNLRMSVSSEGIYETLVKSYPQRQAVLDDLAACDPALLIWFESFINQSIYGRDIQQTLRVFDASDDLCMALSDLKYGDEGSPLNDQLTQEQIALVGVAICGSASMTEMRYQEIVNNIISTWNIPASYVNCELVDVITRIGSPSDSQLALFGKLYDECVMPYDKAFSYLEKAIALGKDDENLFNTLSCEGLNEELGCVICDYDLVLTGDDEIFETCLVNLYITRMIAVFIINHKPAIDDHELEKIYGAEAPCDAAIYYIYTGRNLSLQRTIIDSIHPPSIDSQAVSITPTIIPTQSPVLSRSISQAVILFDGILEPSFFGAQAVFVREREESYNIYVIQDGREVQIDAQVQGKKHHPILFQHNGFTLLAYLLEHNGQVKLRIVTLDENIDGYLNISEPQLPIELAISRITFVSPLIIFTGADNNLYYLNLASRSEDIEIQLIEENAQNPSFVHSRGFIFERYGEDTGVFAWLNGNITGNILEIFPYHNCTQPVAKQVFRDVFVWLLCEGQVYRVSIYALALQEENINDIYVSEIALAELDTDLYIGDDDEIYHYTTRVGEPIVTLVIGGTSQEKSLHFSTIIR